jgi:hypothetical protein
MINNKNYKKQNKDLDPDFEKEAIRDDIMAMVGEMKLLHLQNRDLLNQLDRSVIFICENNGIKLLIFIFFLF